MAAEDVERKVEELVSNGRDFIVVTPDEVVTLQNNMARFDAWVKQCFSQDMEKRKLLAPMIIRNAAETGFSFMQNPKTLSDPDIQARMKQLGDWAYSIEFSDTIRTKPRTPSNADEKRFHAYRVNLIVDTIVDMFGSDLEGFDILDIACHCGVFSLELAERGARHVTGIDIRPQNIDQANFLKQIYGVENCDFEVGDAELLSDRQYDVILNFGILYHTIFPMQLLQYCYDHCTVATVIDTNVYNAPFSAFYFVANKNVRSTIEGKLHMELIPTYEALIIALQSVGFTNIVEIVGLNDGNIPAFGTGHRRCFVAFKSDIFPMPVTTWPAEPSS